MDLTRWSKGCAGGARERGGYTGVGLASAAFHEPELAPQGCLCLSFPNCKASDLAWHLTLFFLVQNAVEPWLKGAYATCRQRVMG